MIYCKRRCTEDDRNGLTARGGMEMNDLGGFKGLRLRREERNNEKRETMERKGKLNCAWGGRPQDCV
jgi:hypothetical protein